MPCKYFYNNTWTEDPPPADQILSTLNADHPRLMIDGGTAGRVRRILETDAHAARWYGAIKADAADILTQPPSHYEIPDGRRLLSVSRRVKERVRTLMFVHLLEGGQQYIDRVWAEIEAAIHFQDWNPSHFLDTAEMTYAVGISYDWLYHAWSGDQRRAMREAIISHGLEPGMRVYGGEARHRWDQNHNNWNQVCNGGLGMGALAIADEHPLIASQILQEALKSIPLPMNYYAPDGAGTEGVTYWSYGARYNILFLSSLETALGTDFGLSQIEGFKESGIYHIYMSGADRVSFNFADCGLARMSTPMHFWMGVKFSLPHYSGFRYSELAHPERNGAVLDLLWFDGAAKDSDTLDLPPDRYFRKAECASMRSAWTPNALVLGIQAGANQNLGGHRHLDLGTFILEALGERWILDVGTERETYQRHRNKREKWEFYRTRAEGHNTLVLNPTRDPDQNLGAVCPITTFESTPRKATAVIDLTDAYTDHARRVQRTFQMTNRESVTLIDELEGREHLDFWWFLHTGADIELGFDTAEALLTQNGKQLLVKIEDGPSLADFEILDAAPFETSPNPDQAANGGIRKLAIHLPDILNLSLTVSLTPVTK